VSLRLLQEVHAATHPACLGVDAKEGEASGELGAEHDEG